MNLNIEIKNSQAALLTVTYFPVKLIDIFWFGPNFPKETTSCSQSCLHQQRKTCWWVLMGFTEGQRSQRCWVLVIFLEIKGLAKESNFSTGPMEEGQPLCCLKEGVWPVSMRVQLAGRQRGNCCEPEHVLPLTEQGKRRLRYFHCPHNLFNLSSVAARFPR